MNPFEMNSSVVGKEQISNEMQDAFIQGDKVRDMMKKTDVDYQMDQGILQSQIEEQDREMTLDELLDRVPDRKKLTKEQRKESR